MSGKRSRTIKLYCPPLSKVVSYVVWEEQKLDIGSISGTFGIDPVTLKLNGHFISRGVDLISSSVTWKSLLSFFSARGLSTGAHHSNPLIVDGRLCKSGTKRARDLADVENEICCTTEHEDVCVNRKPQLEDVDLLKKKKLRESYSGCEERGNQMIPCNAFGLKRKQWSEDVSILKRLKMNTNSGFRGRKNDSSSISNTQFPCSYISENR